MRLVWLLRLMISWPNPSLALWALWEGAPLLDWGGCRGPEGRFGVIGLRPRVRQHTKSATQHRAVGQSPRVKPSPSPFQGLLTYCGFEPKGLTALGSILRPQRGLWLIAPGLLHSPLWGLCVVGILNESPGGLFSAPFGAGRRVYTRRSVA